MTEPKPLMTHSEIRDEIVFIKSLPFTDVPALMNMRGNQIRSLQDKLEQPDGADNLHIPRGVVGHTR